MLKQCQNVVSKCTRLGIAAVVDVDVSVEMHRGGIKLTLALEYGQAKV